MSAATQGITQKHMILSGKEEMEGGGGGRLCIVTSLAHVFGTGGDITNRILGHALCLHSSRSHLITPT